MFNFKIVVGSEKELKFGEVLLLATAVTAVSVVGSLVKAYIEGDL